MFDNEKEINSKNLEKELLNEYKRVSIELDKSYDRIIILERIIKTQNEYEKQFKCNQKKFDRLNILFVPVLLCIISFLVTYIHYLPQKG